MTNEGHPADSPAVHLSNPGENKFGIVMVFIDGLIMCFTLWRTGDLWSHAIKWRHRRPGRQRAGPALRGAVPSTDCNHLSTPKVSANYRQYRWGALFEIGLDDFDFRQTVKGFLR